MNLLGSFGVPPNEGWCAGAHVRACACERALLTGETTLKLLGNSQSVAIVFVFSALSAQDIAYASDIAVSVRIATFNVALAGTAPGDLVRRLRHDDDVQARAVAEIIQHVRPDILLLNEFDYDPQAEALSHFRRNYLGRPQSQAVGAAEAPLPIEYPYFFAAAVNTGEPTGCDLDNDGRTEVKFGALGYARDCHGFGAYPGQYGMAVLSRFPIFRKDLRTFRNFLWRDMPACRWPDDPTTAEATDWYTDEEKAVLRLSSKSHWDLPIRIGAIVLHLLASHPTPPVFDGPEDANGCRNYDEIRFWRDYLDPRVSSYIYDDQSRRGGLADRDWMVVAGDLNCDPHDGDGDSSAIQQLIAHAHLNDIDPPASLGGAEQGHLQGGANLRHRGSPALDTAELPDDPGPGNLRLDYVLPSRSLKRTGGGVFWPTSADRRFALIGTDKPRSSDHRLVWIDIAVPNERDGEGTGVSAAEAE